ncbi:MAG: 6-phosphofructokinase [Chloroflexota bacterium]|nr:6-phosphofructokinase [Chloroflexota bacterium]MDE2947755.1 6-phosphofructokinase [Chloroflexota bacterium]
MKTCIVISGGDAPGINAAIDGYVRLAARNGDRVLGAQGGFAGLLDNQLVEIDPALSSLLAGRGGSILQSSRAPALQQPDARERLARVMAGRGIDNLLVFGGDGTLRHVYPRLGAWGLPCIVLPATIDNDVAGTGYTLGHDSACNFASHALAGIRATAGALPGRVFMLETLGAPTGHLALAIAYAGGAHLALLPEYPLELDWLAARLRRIVERDGYALVVLSEAYPGIKVLLEEIPQRTGIRIRHSALGHAQRGADASHKDRRLARDMSRAAWRAFKDGLRQGVLVAREGAHFVHEGSLPSLSKPPPDRDLVEFVNQL